MKKVVTSPDTYISSLPDDVRDDVATLDKIISKETKGLTRVMWEGNLWGGSKQNIIGYGDYNYVRSGNKKANWFIIGLAVQKNYISVYVNAVEDKQYLSEKYAKELGKVKVGKSSVSFKKVEDINLEVLAEVVRKAKSLMS